jgi:hypothetical protein
MMARFELSSESEASGRQHELLRSFGTGTRHDGFAHTQAAFQERGNLLEGRRGTHLRALRAWGEQEDLVETDAFVLKQVR